LEDFLSHHKGQETARPDYQTWQHKTAESDQHNQSYKTFSYGNLSLARPKTKSPPAARRKTRGSCHMLKNEAIHGGKENGLLGRIPWLEDCYDAVEKHHKAVN